MMERTTERLFVEILNELTPTQQKRFGKAVRKRYEEKLFAEEGEVFVVTPEDLTELAQKYA